MFWEKRPDSSSICPADPLLGDEDDPEWVDDIMRLMKSGAAKEERDSTNAENEQLIKRSLRS